MPLATRRAYAGAAPACTLSSDINASATSFSITGTTTNWPTTATGSFYMVIDPGLSTEEKVLVGARTSGSLSSVTRAVDGTTAASHVAGATCYPVFTAVDANDANLLASRLSAKGDLISSDGTDPTKVAVGSNNTRLVADSAQTSGMKWVADTQNTVVDAKGDLLVGSAADTVARLAVGSDGHVLVADSTATNGLAYSPLNGWRNAIINGDFSVNQRGLNSSGQVGGVALTSGAYGFDRWIPLFTGGTVTQSAQAFTLGNAITGQEPTNFARLVTSSQSATSHYAILAQRIEGVRTFAGQTVTVSFWAKAGSGTPKVAVELQQDFGTGGSPSTAVNSYGGQITLSTSWVRYSVNVSIASISGKTIGTSNDFLGLYFWVSAGSDYNSRTGSLGLQNATFDFWGVQVEAGSDMTTFERRPQQVELALCQRYYYRAITGTLFNQIAFCNVRTTTSHYAFLQLPVTMRANPTEVGYSLVGLIASWGAGVTGLTSIGFASASYGTGTTQVLLDVVPTSAVGTVGNVSMLVGNNSTTGYVALSAEL